LLKKRLTSWNKFYIPVPVTFVLLLLFIGSAYTVFEFIIEPTRLTDGSHPVYFLFLSSVGGLFCTGLAQYLAKKKCFVFVKILGLYSIQIYLVHMLAGVAVRIILLNVFSIENPVLHMITGVSVGLFVPIMLYKIAINMHFPYLFQLEQDFTRNK